MTRPPVITAQRHFEADPADVFCAWLDPAHLGHWIFGSRERELLRCEIDARPGGRFALVERRDGRDRVHAGEFVEIDTPHRLIFRLALAQDRVEVPIGGAAAILTVLPEKTGCRVNLVDPDAHTATPPEGRTCADWEDRLAALAAHLGVWVEKPDIKPFRGDLVW
jgi:uncharacterized protein YndB with AHSA1/START domain